MKKLLLLVILIVAMGVTFAAEPVQTSGGKITPDLSFAQYDINGTLTNADTLDYVFQTGVHNTFTFDAGVNLDKTSGTPTQDSIIVFGRKHPDTNWTRIQAVVWDGTTNKTVLSSHTTAVRYRYIKIRIKSIGNQVVVADNVWLKIWNQ